MTPIVNRIINDTMRKNIDPFNIVFACGIAVGLWDFCNGMVTTLDIMILESLWFYVFLFIAGMVWLYLTE